MRSGKHPETYCSNACKRPSNFVEDPFTCFFHTSLSFQRTSSPSRIPVHTLLLLLLCANWMMRGPLKVTSYDFPLSQVKVWPRRVTVWPDLDRQVPSKDSSSACCPV